MSLPRLLGAAALVCLLPCLGCPNPAPRGPALKGPAPNGPAPKGPAPAAAPSTAHAAKLDPAIEKRVDALLAKMTLEEKVGQLTQFGTPKKKHEPLIVAGKIGSLLDVHGAAQTNALQKLAVEKSRLKIPLLIANDVIHGYRTIFPIPLAEASSWDLQAIEKGARVAAEESAAAGTHWTFAPMVDVARDPRWGRVAEGSGEDPYLGSMIAVARVRGFQGKSEKDWARPDTVLACAKHFVAYGAAEAGRDYNTVDLSERTLREVYFPPFEAAVAAGVGTVMSAFNDVNGVPSTANRFALTRVLRGEWGFGGFVVSDWESVDELRHHGVAADKAAATRLAFSAGVDMDMEAGVYLKTLPKLVRQGLISSATVDASVRRILRIKFKLGLFERPYVDPQREGKVLFSAANLQAALEMAHRSIVLLKNNKALLPLRKDLRSIALLGPLATEKKELLGPWASKGKPAEVESLLEVLKRRFPKTKIRHAKGCEIEGGSKAGIAAAVRLAKRSKVAIIVVGERAEMSGEAASRASIDLPGHQQALVEAVSATGTPVVVVLMNGRPLALPWIAEHVPAILETWFLGTRAARAIADVLFGDVNPSGKLPITFPRAVGQVPIYYAHRHTGRPPSAKKYSSKYLDVAHTPLYPFGFGLSYTSFTLSNLQLGSKVMPAQGPLTLSVDVKNTGSRAGDEVVQVYLSDLTASVTRPIKLLRRFRRVTLAAGAQRTITFRLTRADLSMLGVDLKPVVEPGTFELMVGASSASGVTARFVSPLATLP